MKKNFLKSTIVVVAVAASGLGAWRAYNAYGVTDNTLLVENIEALSAASDPGADEDPWKDCPRDKWIRNAKDSWAKYTAKYEAGIGLYITINGKKVKLGAGAEADGAVFVPTCPDSSGNCCEKAHLDKPYRYA